jgi:hypothetical protein
MQEQVCHEIMALVTVPAAVTDRALCAAIQQEYDEGPAPNGGFILKDRIEGAPTRSVRIYFAVVLDDPSIEEEREYLELSLASALDDLGGTYVIEGVGPAKPFSQIEAY